MPFTDTALPLCTATNSCCMQHVLASPLLSRLLSHPCTKVLEEHPYHLTYISKLDRVQEFAAKVVTRRWSATGSDLVSQLGWPSLLLRRQLAKLCLWRRILCEESLIPATVFEPHPSTSVRHANSQPLFLPRVRADYHRGSFFVSAIPLWNSIPDSITSLNSHNYVI